MSKAQDFVKERVTALKSRPSVELPIPDKDQKCLFRVGRTGMMEYHCCTSFTVSGEHQGETYPQFQLDPEAAKALANWILKTF